ncbi:hypothetical protein BD769DRAFT_1111646 [Suillus cothurnatus]|nr:hypothetical protein BD769DRAFT_1111646 [Suillus cothurnatus]
MLLSRKPASLFLFTGHIRFCGLVIYMSPLASSTLTTQKNNISSFPTFLNVLDGFLFFSSLENLQSGHTSHIFLAVIR